MTLTEQSYSTPAEASQRHAELAGHYASELWAEQGWSGDKHAAMIADQGYALRMVIAHSGAAIASALLELAEATRETGAALGFIGAADPSAGDDGAS